MNYELAKELKDAGFPQQDGPHLIKPGTTNVFTGVYPPTLSELIEALGDNFGALKRGVWAYEEGKGPVEWLAKSEGLFAIIPKEWDEEYKKTRVGNPEHAYLYGTGEAVDEALGRLWLAIEENKKVGL